MEHRALWRFGSLVRADPAAFARWSGNRLSPPRFRKEVNMSREHQQVVGSFVVTAALALGAAACAEEQQQQQPRAATSPPPTPTSETQPSAGQVAAAPQTFTMMPPSGTKFTRIERRRFEAALVGTPLTRRHEEELTWKVSIDQSGDQYIMTQQLARATFKRDDKMTLDADFAGTKLISAQLVIDRAGNLVDIRGLDDTATTLKTLKRIGVNELQDMDMSPEGLKALVATRYSLQAGEIVGRPTKQGSTWTIPGQPNGPVTSRTITVEGMQTCGSTSCARLREDVKLDPTWISTVASDVVKERVRAMGGDPSKVRVKTAMESMTGTMVIEPATMLSHEASLDDAGKAMFEGPNRTFEVALRGTTRFSYDYEKAQPPVAAAPSEPSDSAR
jgi:hypothetical protein